MSVCGVALQGSEAIVVVADVEGTVITVRDNGTPKLKLGDGFVPAEVRGFRVLVETLIRDFGITKVVIRKPSTGFRTSGAAAFIMTAVFELVEGVEVEFVPPQTIAARGKRSPVHVPKHLKKYQADAYRALATVFAPDR